MQSSLQNLLQFELLIGRTRLEIECGSLETAKHYLKLLDAFEFSEFTLIHERRKENLKSLYLKECAVKIQAESCTIDQVSVLEKAIELGSVSAYFTWVEIGKQLRFPERVKYREHLKWLKYLTSDECVDALIDAAELYDCGNEYCERDVNVASKYYARAFEICLKEAHIGSRWHMHRLVDLILLGADGSNANIQSRWTSARHWILKILRKFDGNWRAFVSQGFKGTEPPSFDELCIESLIKLSSWQDMIDQGKTKTESLRLLEIAASYRITRAKDAYVRFIRRHFPNRADDSRVNELLRESTELGSNWAKFELLKLNRHQSKNRLTLLHYDYNFHTGLSNIAHYGPALLSTALYDLLISDCDLSQVMLNFSKAAARDQFLPACYRKRIEDIKFLVSIRKAYTKIHRALTWQSKRIRLQRWLAEKIACRDIYNDKSRAFFVVLETSGLLHDATVADWINLVNALATILGDHDAKFWNQLAIDSQLASVEFRKQYLGNLTTRSDKITRAISSTTCDIGICANSRDQLGLPIRASVRSSNSTDNWGWVEVPDLVVSAQGYYLDPPPSTLTRPANIIPEDFDVILSCTLLEEYRHNPLYFSLESLVDEEFPRFPWKFQRKIFEPKWLAGTQLGKTFYYADQIHLQDRLGRSILSTRNPRLSAEYSPQWKASWPWLATEVLTGNSAWNSTCYRSSINLKAVRCASPPIINSDKLEIRIPGNFSGTLYFDTSEIAWEKGQENKNIGKNLNRYMVYQLGQYTSSCYSQFIDNYEVFKRIEILLKMIGIYSHTFRRFNFPINCPLVKLLSNRLAKFQETTRTLEKTNPHHIVFDPR